MAEKEKLRIDKYLWAIRIFKTRTLASDACKAGRIKLEGQNIKPSHEVKLGETYQIAKGAERKVIKVAGMPLSRTDAKTAAGFYQDVTPEEQTQGFKSMFHSPLLKRDRGAGRPTKRDRREIDGLTDGYFTQQS